MYSSLKDFYLRIRVTSIFVINSRRGGGEEGKERENGKGEEWREKK